ncbi:unnamed protein product, partial [Mesorhabditis belari]|uniref:Diphosphomevalonate decarboxylase n=1 Tax=Mesorhabditis belari TaxID=2138241 RepID=A0AAF3J2S7_9BILA
MNSPGCQQANCSETLKEGMGLTPEGRRESRVCTVRVPINIALVKYWGKRDQTQNIPLNDSLSLTINSLHARTTLRVNYEIGTDSVKINGKSQTVTGSRYQRVFEEVRRWERKRKAGEVAEHPVSIQFEITSETNFPVSAGLASSAAGFAAIAECLQKIFGFTDSQKSQLARLGSGSAIRSIFGGLVRWRRGTQPNYEDSIAESFPSTHWPSLRALILVVDEGRKEYSSTDGMQRTVETSTLLERRIECCDVNIDKICAAFSNRDFSAMADMIMRDSNNFHAVCMDTSPPLMYLNDVSRTIIRLVHVYNEKNGSTVIAYTFDAGPNATLYLEEDTVQDFLDFATKQLRFAESAQTEVEEILGHKLDESVNNGALAQILQVIYSQVGGGPQLLSLH